MATVAFLIEGSMTVDLNPSVVDALTQLGVTSLAVYRDAGTVCVVLDGWAFDAASSTAAARAIGWSPDARALRSVMHTALSADR